MKKAILLAAFLFIGASLLLAAVTIRPFGRPTYVDMDDYFIRNTQSEVAANNVVTAIVFDYRGFDTLGEATVLFTAVLGVAALFRKLKREEQ